MKRLTQRSGKNLLRIREFEDTPQDYESLAHIMNTVWHERSFTADELRQWDEERPPKLVHQRFLAEIADRAVGYGSFEHHEKFYHPQHFWMRLDVLPEQRQQGIGTQLYDHMLVMLQLEYDANELHTITTESRGYSIRFLNKHGFQEDKHDPKSHLNVANFDWTPFSRLAAQIAETGIEIKVLSDLMQEDVDALHKVYELHQLLVSEVPEPAEHTRVEFASWLEGYSSTNPYFIPEANFMALHGTAYIGLTSLWGTLSSDRLYTGMTGVKRAYRRKGIATALKLRTVSFAQTHGTRLLMTSNNSENPMYQLNLKLGFETYDTEVKLVKPMSL
jgi:GNAT superfamily N-acetyltransferase